MSPRTSKQFEDIREEKKTLILNVALELFAYGGYYETSVSKISREAGISKGLLYNYFESKEDLIRTIINLGLDDLGEFLDPNHDGILTKAELRNFIEQFFTQISSNLHFWRLYFALFMQPSVMKIVEKRIQETAAIYIKMISSYFEGQGYEDPETEAMLFAAMMDGIGMNYIANAVVFPMEKMKNKLIKLYCS
jgi:AcrR family transcriptional regulator